MDKLVFTCGDINGIGPEIALKTLNRLTHHKSNSRYCLVIPGNVFREIKRLVKPVFDYDITTNINSIIPAEPVKILLLPDSKLKVGFATGESGEAAFNSLKISFSLLKKGFADAVITAPVSKTALRLAGFKYPGQTELFAQWCKVPDFLMTFISEKINVALASIHLPINSVPGSIRKKLLIQKLKLISQTLKFDLGIKNPRVAVLGLNPHAGEGGLIGREELDEILPAIKEANKFVSVEGPFSSDAFFAKRRFREFDLTFGMYHDQVLIPFKFLNAGNGVNYTAGLPVVRTSPDHGVAYDIAWKGIANDSSMLQAVRVAKRIIRNRKKYAGAANI